MFVQSHTTCPKCVGRQIEDAFQRNLGMLDSLVGLATLFVQSLLTGCYDLQKGKVYSTKCTTYFLLDKSITESGSAIKLLKGILSFCEPPNNYLCSLDVGRTNHCQE
jgi:hypothetical protein